MLYLEKIILSRMNKFTTLSSCSRNIFIMRGNLAADDKNKSGNTEAATGDQPPAVNLLEQQSKKFAEELRFRKKTSLNKTDYTIHDYATSIEYMESEAYKLAYGDEQVWKNYVRNYGGHIKPQWTRLMCVRGGKYGCGNPCPLCRDEYLVVHYKNLKLLKQFICEHTGQLHPAFKTNVCKKQQEKLEVAFRKAIDIGVLDHYIPFKKYDYKFYYDELEKKVTTPSILLNVLTVAKLKNTNKLLKDISDEDILTVNK